MPKKIKITRDKIIGYFMEDKLMNIEIQMSVFAFCKKHGFEESEFYKHFASLEAVEKDIFSQFVLKTVELVSSDENYPEYSSKQKLLSFYYTFVELLNANRSYLLLTLNNKIHLPSSAYKLKSMKAAFGEYIDSLNIKLIELENKNISDIQSKGIKESAWMQLLYLIDFWLKDESKAFEKTDILIEKSVNATFDLIDSPPGKSLLDLAKFLFKEKFKSA